jgi:hypothetical protein
MARSIWRWMISRRLSGRCGDPSTSPVGAGGACDPTGFGDDVGFGLMGTSDAAAGAPPEGAATVTSLMMISV